MLLGVLRLRRAVLLWCVLLVSAAALISCGGYSSSSSAAGGGTSGLKFRAVVSQDVSTTLVGAGLIIINATDDVRAPVAPMSLSAPTFNPGMMVVSDNRQITLAVDRVVLSAILDHAHGNQKQASDLLGISRTTLRAKLQALWQQQGRSS